jgi:hypothetical protein
MGRLCTREKSLKIKEDIHELPCNILTFLLKKTKSAELKKKENRGERKFRASDKIIPLIIMVINSSISKPSTIAVLSVNILSISNSRIF